MKKRKKKQYKVGQVLVCRTESYMEWLIKDLGNKGIDAKPTGNYWDIEIVDIDRSYYAK